MIRDAEPRSAGLERRLAELSRRRAELAAEAPEPGSAKPYHRRSSEAPAAGGQAGLRALAPERYEALPLEEIFAGSPIDTAGGPVFLHERLRSEFEPPRPEWGRLVPGKRKRRLRQPEWEWEPGFGLPMSEDGGEGEGGAEPWSETLPLPVLHEQLERLRRQGLERILFLDLETCGLAQATIFLVGTMRFTGDDFVIHQFLARDYSEEAALLHAVAGELAQADGLVTFNGKAFDLPLLRDRATAARVPLVAPPLHVDLLHHARARWKGELPNCRLVTLEAWVCGRRRVGDVPGSEIPSVYHHFVRTGDAYRLVPVLHHNLLDVVTMEEILQALVN